MKIICRWLIFSCVLFSLFGLAEVWSTESGPKTLEKSLEALGQDLKGISAQAIAILQQREQAAHRKLETYRDELDAKVDELQAKVEKLTGRGKTKTRQYIEIMKAKNQELMEQAQTMLSEAKREFEGHLSQTMNDLWLKIEALRKEMATMSDQNREKLEQRLKELKKSNTDIMRKLEDLESMSTESWDYIKTSVFDIWQELQKTFHRETDLTQFQ